MLPKFLHLIFAIQFIQGSKTQEKSDLCGPLPWQAFGDNKCFNSLAKESGTGELLTYLEALKICQTIHPDATLPTITSQDEQDFVLNLASSKSIWLGGKLNNSKTIWDDQSISSYSNWSKYLTLPNGQFCIILGDDDHAHGHGKWIFNNCSRKSMVSVVCQKPQTWAPSQIQKYVQKHLSTGLLKLQEYEEQILTLRQDLERYQDEVANLKDQVESQGNSSTSRDSLSEVPVGFVYIQYKDQQHPSNLWPDYYWIDISHLYAGQFFRALGGSSASFGVTQSDNSPRIIRVDYADPQPPNTITIPREGTSEYIRTGPYSSNSDTVGIAFTSSGGEVRPLNSAVRMWKRSR